MLDKFDPACEGFFQHAGPGTRSTSENLWVFAQDGTNPVLVRFHTLGEKGSGALEAMPGGDWVDLTATTPAAPEVSFFSSKLDGWQQGRGDADTIPDPASGTRGLQV